MLTAGAPLPVPTYLSKGEDDRAERRSACGRIPTPADAPTERAWSPTEMGIAGPAGKGGEKRRPTVASIVRQFPAQITASSFTWKEMSLQPGMWGKRDANMLQGWGREKSPIIRK